MAYLKHAKQALCEGIENVDSAEPAQHEARSRTCCLLLRARSLCPGRLHRNPVKPASLSWAESCVAGGEGVGAAPASSPHLPASLAEPLFTRWAVLKALGCYRQQRTGQDCPGVRLGVLGVAWGCRACVGGLLSPAQLCVHRRCYHRPLVGHTDCLSGAW